MPVLNSQQLYQYANGAGFSGRSADTIVAIAFAESGGNTAAVNSNDPYGGSFGVLQINGSHIQGLSGTAIPLPCAYDAACSFAYAFGLSSMGTNFTPWSTFTSGAYKQYIKQTPAPVAPVGTGSGGVLSSTTTAASSSDPLSAISGFFTQIQSAASWIANPTRILKVIGGVVCLAGAIWLMATPEGQIASSSIVKIGKKIHL